jgi:hypothetical protein
MANIPVMPFQELLSHFLAAAFDFTHDANHSCSQFYIAGLQVDHQFL